MQSAIVRYGDGFQGDASSMRRFAEGKTESLPRDQSRSGGFLPALSEAVFYQTKVATRRLL